MRTITVSTEVFAAIWAERRSGEETEDAILTRLLKLSAKVRALSEPARAESAGGIYNSQFGVHWPPGFEIFRIYKSTPYRAVVKDGRWFMNGQYYPSLHKLSWKVVGGRENAWMNWKYLDAQGRERLIDARRQNPQ